MAKSGSIITPKAGRTAAASAWVVFLAFSWIFTLVSCGGPQRDSGATPTETADRAPVKGDRAYGNVFRLGRFEEIESIYPHRLLDLTSANTSALVFDGLVRFDPLTLAVQPRVAESWTVSDDGLVYTFKLRKGVHFHDNACFPNGKGREVTAHDVAWTITTLCTPSPNNFVFGYTVKDRIKGATAFYEAAQAGSPMDAVPGLRVVDDYTVEFTLESPSNSFIYLLARPDLGILPREGVEQYSNKVAVGCGAFMLQGDLQSADGVIRMVRNPNYYGVDTLGNQLPYLDSVTVRLLSSKREELELFQQNRLDVVNGLPSESVLTIVEENIDAFQGENARWVLEPNPAMSTDYYQFNMTVDVFKDLRVRQAFNYAINRNSIIDQVLNGEAYGPGVYGISPATFPGYDTRSINGYSFDPDKARALLAEAGYPNGEGFPKLKLELNLGGYKNTNVASAIQNQLRNELGVHIELEMNPMADKIRHDRYALADISRKAWIADFPSPESFLYLFYGASVPESLEEPSFPNTARYVNPEFDALFEQAVTERDQKRSYELYLQAEQVMMNDAPVIVLWYNEAHKLRQSSVHGFHPNAMNTWDLSKVYIKVPESTEPAAQ